jgi:hypothetical protein
MFCCEVVLSCSMCSFHCYLRVNVMSFHSHIIVNKPAIESQQIRNAKDIFNIQHLETNFDILPSCTM